MGREPNDIEDENKKDKEESNLHKYQLKRINISVKKTKRIKNIKKNVTKRATSITNWK